MAVRWYLRHPLSATSVMELLAERDIDVSERTVLRWVQTFGPQLADEARKHRRCSKASCGWSCTVRPPRPRVQWARSGHAAQMSVSNTNVPPPGCRQLHGLTISGRDHSRRRAGLTGPRTRRNPVTELREEQGRMQRILLIGLVLMLVLGSSNVAVAQGQPATLALPSRDAAPTTATSHPWLAWAPLESGYVEEEFQFSGELAFTTMPLRPRRRGT